jgi:hypothetical protein
MEKYKISHTAKFHLNQPLRHNLQQNTPELHMNFKQTNVHHYIQDKLSRVLVNTTDIIEGTIVAKTHPVMGGKGVGLGEKRVR